MDANNAIQQVIVNPRENEMFGHVSILHGTLRGANPAGTQQIGGFLR